MKEYTNKKLLKLNARLLGKILIKNKTIREQKKEIENLNEIIKELKDKNYEISSNNEYLLDQRKKINKRIRDLRRKYNEDIKKVS